MAKTTRDEILKLNIIVGGDDAKKKLYEVEQAQRDLKKVNTELLVEMKKMEKAKQTESAKYKETKALYDANKKAMAENEVTMKKLREEIGITGLTFNQLGKRARELKTQINNMTPGSPERKRLEAELKAINARMREVGVGAKQAENSISSMAKRVGPYIAAAFSVNAVKSMISNIIAVRKEFEKYEAVLINTLGNKSEAQKSLRMIQDFASKTPFSVMELSESFVALTNMGFKPTREEMTKLGDLASSTGRNFSDMAQAIIAAQTGEYERLKAFGVVARVEGENLRVTFKGVTTEIERTGDSIRNYILGLGEMAGVSGSMEAISNTLGGKISNLGDAWEALLNTLGALSGGIIGDVISGFSGMLSWANKLISTPLSESLEKERMEINNLFASVTSLNEGNEARNRLLNELQTKYPEYLGNIDTEKVTNEDILKLQKEINAQFLQRIQLAVYEEELAEIFEKTKSAKEDELKYIRAINREYTEFYGNQGENLSLEEKLIALGQIKTDQYKALTTFLGTNLNRAQQEQNELLEEYNAILGEQQTLLSTMPDPEETETGGGGGGGGGKPVHRNKYGQTFEEWKRDQQLFKGMEEEYWKEISEVIVPEEENIYDESEYLALKYKETLDGRLAFLQAYHNAGLISEAEYNDELLKINKERSEKELDIERMKMNAKNEFVQASFDLATTLTKDGSNAYKIIASLQAAINTYAAATAALAPPPIGLGPVAGWPLAAITIIRGLANVARINAIQFAAGKYDVIGATDGRTYRAGYQGKSNTGIYNQPTLIGGLGLVAEKAPEMVVDGPTLRNIQMNAPEIIQAIHAMRVPQFAAGNITQAASTASTASTGSAAGAAVRDPRMDIMIALLQEVSAKLDKPTRAMIAYHDLEDTFDEMEDIKNSVSK